MMKKLFMPLIMICFLGILSSCGSSVSRDAKKAAELGCKAQKLASEAINGKVDMQESTKLAEEAAKLYSEMQGKYTDEKDWKEFNEVYTRELEKCKE